MPSTSDEHHIVRPSKRARLSATLEQSYSADGINQLPNEVLGEIFLASLEIYQQSRNSLFTEPNLSRPPMIFCQVCGHWTQVALSLPRLWASISVCAAESSFEMPEMIVQCWLKRSKNSGLRFRLGSSCGSLGSGTMSGGELLRLFEEHGRRWQMVSINLDEESAMIFLGVLEKMKPKLEQVQITAQGWSQDMMDSLISKLANCPLKFLNLNWTSNSRPMFVEHRDWSWLTVIQISSEITIKETLDLLWGCKEVRKVKVYIRNAVGNPPVATAQFPIVDLLKLSSFIVYAFEELEGLWSHLSAPVLNSLSIYKGVQNTLQSSEQDAFCEFLERSGCEGLAFSLSQDDLVEADITAYLQAAANRKAPQAIIQTQTITEDVLQSVNVEFCDKLGYREWIRKEDDYIGWTSEPSGSLFDAWMSTTEHLTFLRT